MVIVYGPSNARNESLQYVLSHELGVSCVLSNDKNDFERVSRGRSSKEPVLLLIDGSNGSIEEVLETPESQTGNGTAPVILAVYDLRRGMKVHAETLRKGVRGLFFAEDRLSVLLKGIRALLSGEVWLSRSALLEAALDDELFPLAHVAEESGLSRRELEILAHVSRGETNDEISVALSVSTHTVKTHLYNIYRKINVNNRFQASLWAAKHIR